MWPALPPVAGLGYGTGPSRGDLEGHGLTGQLVQGQGSGRGGGAGLRSVKKSRLGRTGVTVGTRHRCPGRQFSNSDGDGAGSGGNPRDSTHRRPIGARQALDSYRNTPSRQVRRVF